MQAEPHGQLVLDKPWCHDNSLVSLYQPPPLSLPQVLTLNPQEAFIAIQTCDQREIKL